MFQFLLIILSSGNFNSSEQSLLVGLKLGISWSVVYVYFVLLTIMQPAEQQT